ncbi:MAG: methyltransferase domain-containing protein [Actinomycetota bacterium]|nr:methyltransferase domain-containing protein [Actinomycetota bacterium]
MARYGAARTAARRFLIRREQASDPRLAPWPRQTESWAKVCNICGWHGREFASGQHSEGALCPQCASVARDRFLYWCWTKTVPYKARARVLETSPRLGDDYRRYMQHRVDYISSDYDEGAHKASMHLDVQDMDLPSNSLDVILTPHVLEHVPDTEKSLAEMYRVLKPGGSLLLEIPMPQGRTGKPSEPEYHGDNTLVFWRFGWDLRDKFEAAGFTTSALVPNSLIDRVSKGNHDSGYGGADIDEIDLLRHADPSKLTPIANERDSRRYGFEPDFMFVCWKGIKPG